MVVRRGYACSADRWASLSLEDQHVLRVRADLAAVGPRWRAARRSAAVLHGLPLLGAPPREPQLLAPQRTPADKGPSRHRRVAPLDGQDRVTVNGLAATSLRRTVADLLREESLRGGVVCADAALHLGLPRSEVSGLLATMTSWPGIVQARETLRLADPRAESPLESLSRLALDELELPAPQWQVEVWLGAGCWGGPTRCGRSSA